SQLRNESDPNGLQGHQQSPVNAMLVQDGWHMEEPDEWLHCGDPWKECRLEYCYPVNFYGHVEDAGNGCKRWVDAHSVFTMPYDANPRLPE
ncbi:hypothetical protein X801_02968, partial [Opisthorchis viverrini]